MKFPQLSNYLPKQFNLQNPPSKKIYGVAAVAIAILISTKLYCQGGVCKAKYNLNGKVAVITGGNTGIGRETAIGLAAHGCKIIIGARDKSKMKQTANYITNKYKNVDVKYSQLDLASKLSINQFVSFVELNCTKIDFLINNAGVMLIPQKKNTEQGFQMQMGVNHLGHFYLTRMLWKMLLKSKYPRIITVSSRAHLRSKLNLNDLFFDHTPYSPSLAYNNSKLANILFTRQLQKRMNEAQINGLALCLHPGVVRTQLTRYMQPHLKLALYSLYPFLLLLAKNAKQGAQTTLHLVLENPNKLVNGEYYSDCQVGYSNQDSRNNEFQERLWKISQNLLDVKFSLKQMEKIDDKKYDSS